jgi:predicted nucleotidyltransferase
MYLTESAVNVTRETHPQLFNTIEQEICLALAQIENALDIKILYAVELGARAYGYAPANSPYKVGFVFIYNNPIKYMVQAERKLTANLLDTVYKTDLPLSIHGIDLATFIYEFAECDINHVNLLNSTHKYIDENGFSSKFRNEFSKNVDLNQLFLAYLGRASVDAKTLKNPSRLVLSYMHALQAQYILKFKTLPSISAKNLSDALSVAYKDIAYITTYEDVRTAVQKLPVDLTEATSFVITLVDTLVKSVGSTQVVYPTINAEGFILDVTCAQLGIDS